MPDLRKSLFDDRDMAAIERRRLSRAIAHRLAATLESRRDE